MIFKTISETIRNQKYTRYDLYGIIFLSLLEFFWKFNLVAKLCDKHTEN